MKSTFKLFLIALVMIAFSACEKDLIEPTNLEVEQIEEETWRGKADGVDGATGPAGPQGAPGPQGPQLISVDYTHLPFPKDFTVIIQEDEIEVTEIPAQYRDSNKEPIIPAEYLITRHLGYINVKGKKHEFFEIGVDENGLVYYCVINSIAVDKFGFDPNHFVNMEPRAFRAIFEIGGKTSSQNTIDICGAELEQEWDAINP